MTQQPLNQYEAIDIAQHLANHIGGPVKVTHLGNAKGGSQIGQTAQAWPVLHHRLPRTQVAPEPSVEPVEPVPRIRRRIMPKYKVLVDVGRERRRR